MAEDAGLPDGNPENVQAWERHWHMNHWPVCWAAACASACRCVLMLCGRTLTEASQAGHVLGLRLGHCQTGQKVLLKLLESEPDTQVLRSFWRSGFACMPTYSTLGAGLNWPSVSFAGWRHRAVARLFYGPGKSALASLNLLVWLVRLLFNGCCRNNRCVVRNVLAVT